jgi:hypothetical protein
VAAWGILSLLLLSATLEHAIGDLAKFAVVSRSCSARLMPLITVV